MTIQAVSETETGPVESTEAVAVPDVDEGRGNVGAELQAAVAEVLHVDPKTLRPSRR